MRIKHILSLVAILAISKSTFAQYARDAVRFSGAQTGSTSRIKAIGNAGTAVGGDLSSVSGNPAGLGFFTKSEFSLTPEFNSANTDASYLGTSTSQSKSSGNLNNVAAVFYGRLNTPRGTSKTKGWLSLNFGVGYARTNDFGERIGFGGKNNTSSINNYYADLANKNDLGDNDLQSWAYDHNLIDLYGTTANPSYAANNVSPISTMQAYSAQRSGGQSEFNLSMGANYSNKLYLGFGLGITSLRYNSSTSFNETGVVSVAETAGAINRDYNSAYYQDQTTRGSGINAKFGLIYKIVESVRLGAQVTTPTFMSVDDIYSEGLNSNLSNNNKYRSGPSDYSLTYTMRTPFKAAGGLSVFLGKAGFLAGDIEYVNYSSTHINTNDSYNADFDNSIIRNTYKGAVNTRFGAEFRLPGNLQLRGGYGIQGSPLKQGGTSTKTASGGLGYRFANYYIDATYQHIDGSQIINPYLLGDASPAATAKRMNNNAFLTFGVRF